MRTHLARTRNLLRRHAFILAAMAAFLFIGVAQNNEVLTSSFVWDERFSEYIPWRVEAGRQLRAGQFPFFTSAVFGGMPLFTAAYNGVLYPLNWLYAFFGPALANYLAVAHTIIGGMGMLCYLRRVVHSRFAAFIGALFFVTGTFGLIHEPHISMREAAMLAPWGAWAAVRAMEELRGHWILALLFALHLSIGYWQVTLFTMAWMFVDWAARFRADSSFGLSTIKLFFTILAGIALMAVQLVPTNYHVQQTPRADLTLESWQAISFPPSHSIIFFMPRALGTAHRGWAGAEGVGELLVTISPAAWVLVLVSLVFLFRSTTSSPRRKLIAAFIAASVVAMLLAIGRFFPPNALLFHIPPFNVFRIPARWLFLVTTFACILASISLDEILHMRRFKRISLVLAAWLILGAALLGFFAATWERQPGQSIIALFRDTLLLRELAAWHYIILVGYLAVLLLPRRSISAAFVVLLATTEYRLMEDSDLFPPARQEVVLTHGANPLLEEVSPHDRVYSLYLGDSSPDGRLLPHNTAMFLGYRTMSGYSPLLHRALPYYLGIGQDGRTWRNEEMLLNPNVLAQFGVQYLLVDARGASPELIEQFRALMHEGTYFPLDFIDDRYALISLETAEPRFDFARKWKPAPSYDVPDRETLLAAHLWNTTPGRNETVELSFIRRGDPEPPEVIAPASIHSISNDESDITLTAYGDGLMIIRDMYWQGWMYRTLDAGTWSRWNPMLRVNGFLRGVPVGADTSRVQVRFVPPGFYFGLLCSALGALGVLVLFVLDRRRTRKS